MPNTANRAPYASAPGIMAPAEPPGEKVFHVSSPLRAIMRTAVTTTQHAHIAPYAGICAAHHIWTAISRKTRGEGDCPSMVRNMPSA